MTVSNPEAPVLAPPSMQALSRPCIVCGAAHQGPLYRVLQQCRACGFIRADLDVDEEQIKKLYQEDYFRGREYGDYVADREVHRKNIAHRFAQVTRVAGPLDSMFEIGCAYGFWLEFVSSQGVRCAGADVCPEAVEYAVGVLKQNATSEDFLHMDLRPGEYQTFCMWDTIEHLARPELFVERIFQLLPRGGWFFATTGDIGSKEACRAGPGWRMIHPPTHLQYFSRRTMSRFLERRGFEVVAIRSTPVYRSIRGVLSGLLLFQRGLKQRAARLADKLIPNRMQERLGFWLDLGDIMLVCARKP
jgi:SAM-dependent methyltransferase